MKTKLLGAMSLFAAFLIVALGLCYWIIRDDSSDPGNRGEQLVALNEISQLTHAALAFAAPEAYPPIGEKITAMQDHLSSSSSGSDTADYNWLFLLAGGSCLMFLAVLFGYVYYAILRPFHKMERFAQQIAAGNFDLPLHFNRSNYFGAFTWAFDSMRREITRARSCEREAIENNKTVIATLSHDIKTPISSIRAYAEALEAHLDSSPEKRAQYLEVMIRKCEEVSRLTNDLFLHALADLDKLRVHLERVEMGTLLAKALEELSASSEQETISFYKPDFACYVLADRNRMVQVIENLVNNAVKYARTPCQVTLEKADGLVQIRFRDHGAGIPDEDLPFICNKFYRGKNSGTEQGSGLGLYIVKYIMEQHKGRLLLRNCAEGGLEAMLELPEA